MRSNRSNLRPTKKLFNCTENGGVSDRKKNWAICTLGSKHTHGMHRHWLLLEWTTRSNMHIQEESFSTNKLTEMSFFFVLKTRVEALCASHAMTGPRVQRGFRLVYTEKIVQAYFYFMFISFS